MSIYAVGDIQGCLQPLECLLQRVKFDPAKDVLWSVGDSINRGPACLDTLRFLYAMRDSLVMVLGNHDLHLLAVAAGARKPSPSDTLKHILAAPDRDELLQWLATLPLLHHQHDHVMVHAGIPPQWNLQQATALAAEVEEALRGPQQLEFLSAMYGNEPLVWNDDLIGMTRLRVITNYLTRMRLCTSEGELDLKKKGEPDDSSKSFLPWFKHSNHQIINSAQQHIIFGHWAALQGKTQLESVIGLDTGCVWNGAMTLYNLETRERLQCQCSDGQVSAA